MVRVPSVEVLCLSEQWRKAFGYPEPSRDDWNAMMELRWSAPLLGFGGNAAPTGQREFILTTARCLKLARGLSFMFFLKQRMLDEAREYTGNGIRHLILDFSSSNYCDELGLYWIARVLAEEFANASNNELWLGIRTSDEIWSVDIACRLGYDAVFCVETRDFAELAIERNRRVDCKGLKRPMIFTNHYGSEEGLCESLLEGVVAICRDEDEMDAFGVELDGIGGRLGVEVPLCGFYEEEIVRGEERSDMVSWGARDYIIIDKEVRKKGRNDVADGEMIKDICAKIAMLT